ncbi:alpha/beta fold hydrolase [Alicyclobacillus curvatus]|nr:alpha/beta fold hydrolase [Alicyclobacillus curvatus]
MHTVETVNVRGTNVRLLQGGEGPVLIYFHGAAGGGEWLPFLEQLSAHYRVLAPEHPGFGESDDLPDVDSMQDLAFFYLDFLDQLGIEKVGVIGSSLGGWLALELATLAPHRVSRMVITGSAGIRVEGVQLTDLFMLDDREHLEILFHDESFVQNRLAAASIGDTETVLLQARNRASVAHLAWNPYFHNPKLRQRVHRITMPVLVVWGEHDRVFPLRYGEEFERILPDAKLRLVRDCGHLPAQEKSAEFVALTHNFFSKGVR